MGMTEEFETSLQVLRGFETDISVEVNEIKVINSYQFCFFFVFALHHDPHIKFMMSKMFIQSAVASANRRTTVRFAELKQRRYWLPLMVFISYLSRNISFNQSICLVELDFITMTIRA